MTPQECFLHLFNGIGSRIHRHRLKRRSAKQESRSRTLQSFATQRQPFYGYIYYGWSKRASGTFCTEVIEFSGNLQYVGGINPLYASSSIGALVWIKPGVIMKFSSCPQQCAQRQRALTWSARERNCDKFELGSWWTVQWISGRLLCRSNQTILTALS